MANPFAAIVGQRRAQSLLSRSSKLKNALGPWPRGMLDGPGAVDDVPAGAALSITNLDPTSLGSYKSRPGFREIRGASDNTWTGYILGSSTAGLFTQRVKNPNTVVELTTQTSPTTNPTAYTNASFSDSRTFSRALVYSGSVWLIPSTDAASAGKGGYLSGYGTPGSATFTLAANMPQGRFALIHRDRLFIINPTTSRVYYSKATDFTTWAAPDGGFFDVNPNDGETITGIALVNNILHIFKSRSIWLFTFTTDPGVDGFLRILTPHVGSLTNVVVIENVIYFGFNYSIYSLVGTTLNIISKGIALSNPQILLALYKKLLVGWGTGGPLTTYKVYHTTHGIWTQWTSSGNLISNATRITDPYGIAGAWFLPPDGTGNLSAYLPGPTADSYIYAYPDEVESGLGNTTSGQVLDLFLSGNVAIAYSIRTAPFRLGGEYFKIFGVELDFAASQSFTVTGRCYLSNPNDLSYTLTIPAPSGNTYWEGRAKLIPQAGSQRTERTLNCEIGVTFTAIANPPGFSWLDIKNIYLITSGPKTDINTIQRTLTQ